MVRSTDRSAMTIAVDLGRKATKQTNKKRHVPLSHEMARLRCFIDRTKQNSLID